MGRGMGCATRGGGAVGSGPKNKTVSETSKKTGPIMMNAGGMVPPAPPKGAKSTQNLTAPQVVAGAPAMVASNAARAAVRAPARGPASRAMVRGTRQAVPTGYKKGGKVRKMRMGGSCD